MTVPMDVRAEEEAAWAEYDAERQQLVDARTPEDLWPPRKASKRRLAAEGLGEAA